MSGSIYLVTENYDIMLSLTTILWEYDDTMTSACQPRLCQSQQLIMQGFKCIHTGSHNVFVFCLEL